MRDVIVIGAGLAGLMGALTLADAGRKPYVIAKGHGATHWTAGTIDLWGATGQHDLTAALDHCVRERPEHPYARVGVGGITAAVARFRRLAEAGRYPYVGSFERNVLLPTAAGALRPTAFFPATMAAGDARLPGDVLIAGFRELRDFYPEALAANLRAQGIGARSVYLQLPPETPRRLDFNTRVFADLFDTPSFRASVGQQLRAQRGSAARIVLPAVLGLQAPMTVLADLQEACGAAIFEIPTLPASVPGMRLFTLFERAIVRQGGRLQIGGWAHGVQRDGTRLLAVTTQGAARTHVHAANAFLLATGGVAGGGLRTDHRGAVVETAFNLPVLAPGGRGSWFSPRLLAPEGHAIYRAGIATDTRLRPIDGQRVLYDNVAVAGAALSGADLVRERCYSGVALATGWQAARVLAGDIHENSNE